MSRALALNRLVTEGWFYLQERIIHPQLFLTALNPLLFVAQCWRTADLFYHCSSRYVDFSVWFWRLKWKSSSGESLNDKNRKTTSAVSLERLKQKRSKQEFRTKPSLVQFPFIKWFVKTEANVCGQLRWIKVSVLFGPWNCEKIVADAGRVWHPPAQWGCVRAE